MATTQNRRPALSGPLGTGRSDPGVAQAGLYRVGPRVVDGVISLQPLESADQLPKGLFDRQDGGSYRLVRRRARTDFEYVVGPDGPKRHLFPSNLKLFQFHVEGDDFVLDVGPPQVPKLVFLGVRPCELAAIEVQDRVFGTGRSADVSLRVGAVVLQIRQQTLLIAVNCTRPGGTCFCASWGTGPQATKGFDLAMTELRDGFVVDIGPSRGAALAGRTAAAGADRGGIGIGRDEAGTRPRAHGPPIGYRRRRRNCSTRASSTPSGTKSPTAASPAAIARWSAPPVSAAPSPTRPTWRAKRSARTRQWESCFTHQFTYTIGGPGAKHDPRPIPPLAAAQALHLVGAIRLQRLRGLRPLHHLVPGGH